MLAPRRKLYAAIFVFAVVSVAAIFLVSCDQNKLPTRSAPISDTTIKILISEEGLYHLSLEDVRKAGLGIESLESPLRLSTNGNEVPYHVIEDGLVFYGLGPGDRYSNMRAYLLQGDRPGKRMSTISVRPQPGPVLDRTIRFIHREEDLFYDGRASFAQTEQIDEKEPWYWATINVAGQFEDSVDLRFEPIGPATIRVGLWGATSHPEIDNDHDLDLSINDQFISTIYWDGEAHYDAEIDVPANILRKGTNHIRLDNSGEGAVAIDIMRLDWIDIEYSTGLESDNEKLMIDGFDGTASIAPFGSTVAIFDVSKRSEPKLASDWQVSADGINLSVVKGQKLLLVADGGYEAVEQITALLNTDLRNTNHQADLIILTTNSLIDAVEPLAAARRGQGLTVTVTTLEEVIDEFGFGQYGPDSIRAFVKYASESWRPPKPSYLLLVGDATYDYRHHLGQELRNEIPAPMVQVEYSGETISDSRLVDIDDDNLPELAVGRWPVDEPDQVSGLVSRTLAYESGRASETAVFAADGTSPEFGRFSDQILDAGGLTDNIARQYGASVEQLAASWNDGAWILSYVGHGSLERWGKDLLFGQSTVESLTSRHNPPVVLHFTCLTGFFAHPSITSLAETMLLAERGPVLEIAPSSLSVSSYQLPFATAIIKRLNDQRISRIGDALLEAKNTLDVQNSDGLRQISDTFGLLGDPSALIVRPQ